MTGRPWCICRQDDCKRVHRVFVFDAADREDLIKQARQRIAYAKMRLAVIRTAASGAADAC